VQDVLAQYFDEEARFVAAGNAVTHRSAAASTSPMRKLVTVSSGFCNPPAENPRYPARAGSEKPAIAPR